MSRELGSPDAERTFGRWAARYPTRFQQHRESIGRVERTRQRRSVEHAIAGDRIKAASR
jgi:hypothetical protein